MAVRSIKRSLEEQERRARLEEQQGAGAWAVIVPGKIKERAQQDEDPAEPQADEGEVD